MQTYTPISKEELYSECLDFCLPVNRADSVDTLKNYLDTAYDEVKVFDDTIQNRPFYSQLCLVFPGLRLLARSRLFSFPVHSPVRCALPLFLPFLPGFLTPCGQLYRWGLRAGHPGLQSMTAPCNREAHW